jgi:hypothetical protein
MSAAMRLHLISALVVVLSLAPFGCKDQGKESAKRASEDVDALADQVAKDVGEIERGLPEGAKKMSTVYDKGADPHTNVPSVRQALMKAQREVPDLNIAKSTFFALVDDKGIAIRNNLEQDVMAGQDLFKLFPDLNKALSGTYVTAVGSFGGKSANGPDRDWVAAMPVNDDAGKVRGLYVTGWALRAYCNHLSEEWKRRQAELAKASGDTGKLPVFYVGVFDKTGVYTASLTPAVNEKAMTDLGLVDKTANGTFTGSMTLTDRDFGYAAKRTPKLGPDMGIVVLRSEL